MSDDKYAENDPERTLITLDQLSQTIEVMTSVVNRLRRHLSEQLKSQIEKESAVGAKSEATDQAAIDKQIKVSDKSIQQTPQKRESFVVEISQQEAEPARKTNKILH